MLKKLLSQFAGVFMLSLPVISANAGTLNWHMAIGGGIASGGNTQDVVFSIGDMSYTNRYIADEDHKFAWLVNGGLGMTSKLTYWLNLYVGVDAYYVEMGDHEGLLKTVIESNNPICDLAYSYNVRSIPVFLSTRLTVPSKPFQPYLLAGLGVSWNRASDYKDAPIDQDSGNAPTMTTFVPASKNAIAFELGAGMKGHLSSSTSLALEYHFMHLGEAELGAPDGFTSESMLKTGDNNLHMLVLKIIFGDTEQ